MRIPTSTTNRTNRPQRRINPGHWGRDNPLLLEQLESRTVPSVNIPLNGLSWTELGPHPIAAQRPGETTSSPGNLNSTGRLAGVAAHPTNPNIVYIASAGGGVAKTTDGGVTWNELTDRIPGLTDDQRSLHMGSIAVSPVQNPSGEYNVYAGEGELVFSGDAMAGKGVLKSTDGGASWTLIEGPAQEFVDVSIQDVVVVRDPANKAKEIVFVATSCLVAKYATIRTNGIYRSNDGGNNWVNITENLNSVNLVDPLASITDFAVDPNNPNFGYVAIGFPFIDIVGNNYALNGVYRTTNGLSGDPDWTVAFGGNGTFVPGTKLGRIEMEVAPTRPSTLYAAVTDERKDTLLGLFRSSDAGINWRQVTNVPNFLPGQASYNFAMLVDNKNENNLFLSGLDKVVMATDAATAGDPTKLDMTWSDLTLDGSKEGPHVDHHALGLDASGRLLAGSDGGLFRADLLPAGSGKFSPDWVSMNGTAGPNALNVVQFIGIGLHPQSAEELFGGTQDNGLIRFFDDGDLTNRTVDGWANSNPLAGDSGNFIYDFVNPSIMFNVSVGGATGGNARVTRSLDGGKTWAAATNGIGTIGKGDFYPVIEIDPSNSQRLFFGEDQVYVTKDSAANWAAIGPGMPYVTGVNPPDDGRHPVTAIGVSRFDGNVVYAAVGERWQQISGTWVNFGPALYEINLNLTGQGFPTWVDISPGNINTLLPPLQGAPMNPAPNDLFGPITDIAVDPFDANIAYITVDTPFGAKIYRTTDGEWLGQTPTWVDITGIGANALPRRAYSVAIDSNVLNGGADDDIYVGTEIGVYRWRNPTTGTPVWTRVGGDSLPDALVTDVEINTSTGILSVATYGRGIWQFQIRAFISGYKFEDINGNGIRDFTDTNGNGVFDLGLDSFTEPGLPGFSIIVDNLNNGTEQANTVTRADGYYEFRSLPDDPFIADNYQLREDLTPFPDWQQSSKDLPPFNNLVRESNFQFQNFGNFHRTSISGIKFDDRDGDGVLDSGETGLPGWTIQLLNAETQQVLDTEVTGPGGVFSFDNLPILQVPDPTPTQPNRMRVVPYTLREINQTGWVQTLAAGGNIFLTSGTPNTGNNFGNFQVFSIIGVKYEDLNGNGIREANEPGLPNWTIALLDATGQPIRDALNQPVQDFTDITGKYEFQNLPPRDANNQLIIYRVREVVQPGWAQVSVDPPDVPPQSGAVLQGGDFGNFRLITVSGSVFDDTNGDGLHSAGENTPVGGGIVNLFNTQAGFSKTTLVQADGTYSFPNLQPIIFNGQLVPFSVDIAPPAGYIRTTALPPAFTITSGQSVTGIEFGVFQSTSIIGILFHDFNGNGVQDGGEPDGLDVTGASIVLINGQTGQPVLDSNGNPVGQQIGKDGKFTFPGLAPVFNPGTNTPYRIRITPPTGWVLTTPSESKDIRLQSGIPIGPILFGGFQLTSISGQVFNDLNGDGIRQANETGGVTGAKVSLFDTSDGSVITTVTVAGDGQYKFAGLGPLLDNNINSPYRVEVAAPAGWVLTSPNSTEVVVRSGTPAAGRDFAGFKLISIAGRAFDDKNANLKFDAGELGLPNWQITVRNLVTGASANVVTDKTGQYSFVNLGPGVYQVREVLQAGWMQLTPDPADTAAQSGVNVSGQTFANFRRVDISGRVVEDLNRDGVLDATEPGRDGWTINLLDAGGITIASQLTDTAGLYTFPALGPGKYDVRIVPQTGWIRTTADPAQITSVSGVNVPNISFGVLRLGSIRSFVYSDNNRNGRQDIREVRLENVQVFLRDASDTIVKQTVTNANGEFDFFDLEAGKYKVQFLFGPAGSGFVFSNPDFPFGFPVTITTGSGTAGNDIRTGLGIASTPVVVTGADKGGGPHVQVFDALTSQLKSSFFAYDPSFSGGVRVAQGDVTGDGVADYLTAVGPGGAPNVRGFNGVTGEEIFSFFAYEPSFTGGMFIAAGDVNGDGIGDIITGTDIGGGPRVQVFDGKTRLSIRNYFAYESTFRGGVRVAAGDVNGDGLTDIVTTPAEGGGPRVTAFDGITLSILSNFFAFDPVDRAGVYVSAGDMTGDDVAEIIVGQGATDNPLVRIFTTAGVQLASNQAFPPDEFGNTFKSEVRVSVTDRFGDGKLDAVVTSGPGSLTRLRFLDLNLVPSADELRPYTPDFTGGVYVG